MTRRQMGFVIGINALISTLITLLLVLVILPRLDVGGPAPSGATEQVPPAMSTQPAAGETPSPTPVVHIVQAGDTISGLSQLYDVPAEDIIAANQLENPNFLQLGTELLIPVGGFEPPTPTLTAVPTPTETEIPFEPPSVETATAGAEIAATDVVPTATVAAGSELLVDITEVLGAGQVDLERVIIGNMGERLADMQGWTLSDAAGNVYTFPNFRLWKGGSVILHSRIGQDGNPPANFYWGKLEAIWSPGEVATLKDDAGRTVATYTVGP